MAWTKEYEREYSRAWRQRNREKIRADAAAYRATHKKGIRANQRRWYHGDLEKHRKAAADRSRRYRQRYRDKLEAQRRQRRSSHKEQARLMLQRAVHEGRVRKPSSCEGCGRRKRREQLHGHHPNYAKPLTVVWLCPACHTAEHRKGR